MWTKDFLGGFVEGKNFLIGSKCDFQKGRYEWGALSLSIEWRSAHMNYSGANQSPIRALLEKRHMLRSGHMCTNLSLQSVQSQSPVLEVLTAALLHALVA